LNPENTPSAPQKQFLSALVRLGFVLLSSTVMVFFSEKVYWYPQGYAVLELILVYAMPVYICLWAVQHFRVQRFSALILIAALFGFLVEGTLTPVLYEGGPLDPIMPAYFVGWHGLLGVVYGWYALRKWLVQGRTWRLMIGSGLMGILWGAWSLTYWLPENIAEWEHLADVGEAVSGHTRWTAPEFALYALTFTGMLLLAHGLLGRGGWETTFQPGRWEIALILLGLGFFFTTQVLFVVPLGILKLITLLGIIYLGLRANKKKARSGSLLDELAGPVKLPYLLTLLVMPLTATLVYAGGTMTPPAEDLLRALMEMMVFVQAMAGGIFFVWGLIKTWAG
jgi:hypothetical protein